MKSVLLSVRPEWVAKILNGEKTIEIRKKFPKDYVGWVYIYCCAEDKNGYLIRNRSTKKMEYTYNGFVASVCWLANRKVVARFWCDKVEEIIDNDDNSNTTKTLNEQEILEKSCLTEDELVNYLLFSSLNDKCKWVLGYAIRITKLEIFDKPKEISEFSKKEFDSFITGQIEHYKYPLTRAPQSYCFIEV